MAGKRSNGRKAGGRSRQGMEGCAGSVQRRGKGGFGQDSGQKSAPAQPTDGNGHVGSVGEGNLTPVGSGEENPYGHTGMEVEIGQPVASGERISGHAGTEVEIGRSVVRGGGTFGDAETETETSKSIVEGEGISDHAGAEVEIGKFHAGGIGAAGTEVEIGHSGLGGSGTAFPTRSGEASNTKGLDGDVGAAVRRQRWANRCMIAELAVIIILLLMFMAMVWKSNRAVGTTQEFPEYEDNTLTGAEDDGGMDGRREISIAVMHDYTVSEEQPEFTVGYPDQNRYEIEILFCDSATGKERYRTKRIAPGTQVSVPGYAFCELGVNKIDAVIRIYKPKSQELVSDSTTMQFNVTKK